MLGGDLTTIRPIYELQEMDSTIDRQQSELATVEARLVDNKLMEELKRRLSTNEECLMQTKSSQAMQDLDAKQFQAKVQSLEERLYGGSVRNQKELESITSELQYSKEQSTVRRSDLSRPKRTVSLLGACQKCERRLTYPGYSDRCRAAGNGCSLGTARCRDRGQGNASSGKAGR